MATIVKTAQQVNAIIDKYNQACTDFNDARTMSDAGKAALAGTRVMEALIEMSGLNLPLSADPAEIIKQVDKLRNENRLIQNGITEPEVYKSLGLPVPKFDDKGGTCPIIDPITKPLTDAAKAALPPRYDPLTLDLDGDGLETTGIAATNPILFDHDGDGIKNGTGWVSSDDGFLVRDINGNGSIDSGRELFGDSTIKSNGQLATDGFDALKDLDSNLDGKISNLDAQFASLRVWRDLNQDGISQTGELFTLASLNIASINVAKTANSQTLANGNQIADLGSFTKTDGSTGTAGAVTGSLADINLASDTFHRTFPNVLDTTSVATLPDMQGSGKVRDLREAATQSTTLQSLLTQYSATTTRVQQTALIDQLLDAWADTGGMAESMAQRVAAMTGYTRADGVVIPYVLSSNLTAAWIQKLHIIETFNGSYFFGLPGTTQNAGAVTGLTITTPTATSTNVQITANLNQQQLDLLQQSYDAIKGSVYDALVIQTRFKPLLDQINLVIDATGIKLDFSQVEASFNTQIANNAEAGLLELIDFNFATQNMLAGTSWQGWTSMAAQLEITQTAAVNEAFTLNNAMVTGRPGFMPNGTVNDDAIIGDALAGSLSGGAGNDVLIGLAGNDTLNAGIGDDILIGGTGNDTLYGNEGIDTLIGGAGDDNLYAYTSYNYTDNGAQLTADDLTGGTGNDYLVGTGGANIYRYNLGDGTDTINAAGVNGVAGAAVDKLILGAGITAANVSFGRSGNNLIIKFTNVGDQITLTEWYSYTSQRLSNIQFADGTLWGEANFLTVRGTVAADSFSGTNLDDVIYADDGNDTVYGNLGNDKLYGENGNDTLYGNEGIDTLDGGAGIDTLTGGLGNDTYIVDLTTTNALEDTLTVGAVGDGIDTIKLRSGAALATATTLTLAAEIENLDASALVATVLLNLTGNASNNQLTGNAAANTLIGGDGNDTLNGGTGIDGMTGGAGDDVYYIDTTSDTTIEVAGGGVDTVYSQISYNMAAEIEVLRVYGTQTTVNMGNELNNTIISGDGNNSIDGAGGIDLVTYHVALAGVNGNLTTGLVTGGSGSDTLINIESLRGSAFADTLTGNAGANSLTADAGNDSLNGGDGSDTLVGGLGADSMTGGLGDDAYYVDNINDVVIEDAVAGNDVLHSTITWTLATGNNVERLYLIGADAVNATGNELDNVLYGHANAAINTLTGGLGNDAYYVGSGDIVVEQAGQGIETIYSTISWTLATGNNVERLYLYGTAAVNAIGNEYDNILYGSTNTAVNSLTGGLGSDTYYVDSSDIVIEAVAQGNDTVYSTGNYILSANIENLYLNVVTAATLTGNDLANSISGNAGNDALFGGLNNDSLYGSGGNDTLDGGAGIDTLDGGLGADTFDFNAITESLVGAGLRDVINNFFSAQLDKIDLSTIDASVTAANDQAFLSTLLTTGAFTAEGQLRLVGGILSGNTDSNFATSEFEIQLTGVTMLTGADFVL